MARYRNVATCVYCGELIHEVIEGGERWWVDNWDAPRHCPDAPPECARDEDYGSVIRHSPPYNQEAI